MRISRYTIVSAGLATALLLFITVLSIVLYTNGPRVRLVSFQQDPASVAVHRNNTITVTFDRSIMNNDYSQQISFEPAVDFEARTAKQSIVVTLQQNLSHNTEYTMRILPGITDQTGREMEDAYTHSFKTSNPSYMYAERRYGIDYSDEATFIGSDREDSIWRAELNGEREEIFTAPVISQFVANQKYAVVTTLDQDLSKLFTINLETKTVREESVPSDERIDNLAISPRGNIVLYTLTPEFNAENAERHERNANRVEVINLDSGSRRSLVDGDGVFVKSFSPIFIDPSGQAALVKDAEQTYYAVSPFNDYEPIVLGARSTSFGFNDNGSEVVFRDNTNFSRYDVVSGEVTPYEFDRQGFVRDVVTVDDTIFYQSNDFFGDGLTSYIEKIDSWEDTDSEEVWSNSDSFYIDTAFKDFDVSHDGELLSIHIHSSRCTFDGVSSNSQCPDVQTVLYDTATKEVISTFNGFDLVWLP